MSNFTEEQIKLIKNMGALSYSYDRVSAIMLIEETTVKKYMNDPNCDFYKYYISGQEYSNYLIDLKLLELAHSGDLKAIDKLEERKRKNKKPPY